jgi:ferredoxin
VIFVFSQKKKGVSRDNIMSESIITVFKIPTFCESFLDIFFTLGEVHLIETISHRQVTAKTLSSDLDISIGEVTNRLQLGFLKFLFKRETINGVDFYSVCDFATYLGSYLGYILDFDRLDSENHKRLAQWSYENVRDSLTPDIEALIKSPENALLRRYNFLHPNLIESFLETVDNAFLVPCACRRITRGQDHSKSPKCLTFNDHVTDHFYHMPFARELPLEEVRDTIYDAYREGLMQMVNIDWRETGPKYLCNCCSCCCKPCRAQQEIPGAGSILFHEKYYAKHLIEKCEHCGLCIKRCNFKAFCFKKFSEGKRVHFDAEKCWGCTVCVATCPSGAIEISPSIDDQLLEVLAPRKKNKNQ